MADVFSLVGKITLDYSDAVKGLDSISEKASDTAEALDKTDKSAQDAGNSAKQSGKDAESASGGFTIWKGVISDLTSKAIQGLIAKCAELGNKMIDLTKQAVGNYADYEQLVGGVETLFGKSADTVVKYAEGAYKTAGLSSNEYMETVTSFSASLLQGLNGDTAKAAEIANLAITDMSDNANKMGTSMGDIQNAYQGFAKQNYTMLDNLKLGYGGTQSEMIRLINDSGVLNEKIESLDGISFDTMIQAIHKIQDNMGITGTTALEAGTTISGSWGSVQALFENILTKVGGQLAPTILDFLQQLAVWLEKVDWDKFAQSLGDAFSSALDWLQQVDFESFFETAFDTLQQFITGLAEFIPHAVSFIQHVSKIITHMGELAPVIIGVATALGVFKAGLAISALISTVSNGIKAFRAANEGATVAQALLNSTMLANPFVLIAALIAGVVAAIIVLWNTNEDFRNAVIKAWEAIKSFLLSAWNTIKSTAETVWNGIVNLISGLMTSIQNTISNVWNTIKTVTQTVWNAITSVISNILTGIKDTFTSIWDAITSAISTAWQTIQNIVQVGILLIKEIISAAFQILTVPWRFIWENFGSYLTDAWEAIKSTISSALEAIRTVISNVWNAILAVLTPIVNAIKTGITNAWNTVSNVTSTVMNAVKTVISNIWNAIKAFISSVVSAISSTVSSAWNSVKSITSSVMNAVKSVISSVWNAIKSVITSVMNSIKSTVSSIWNGIKSTISNVINGIKSTISSGLNSAKSTVTNIFNSIKNTISNVMNGAKNVVGNAISAIRSKFNFSWSLPKLKLPHPKISGSFSLNPPSVPHFSIDWYAKAMKDGMIMNQPTVFGFNPATNSLMAGGEAGSETVVGTESLMSMIRNAVSSEMENLVDLLYRILDILSQFLPELQNMQVVLDDGTLVGRLTPAIDRELGRISGHKERGN